MQDALDLCELAATAVATVDLHAAHRQELALGALGLQRHLDRMTALHAKVVAAGDRAGVWQGSGARSMADWLAAKTNTSYGDAVGRMKLADTFDRSPELAQAVENGEVTAAAAQAIHDAIANPPDGADVSELIDAVKGAGPRDAKAAAERWKEVNATETDEQAQERQYRKRSLRSGAAVDGMVATTVTLPTLQSRQFINAISHVAGKPSQNDSRTTEQRLADGLVQLCAAYAKGAVVGGREKPTILITIDVDSFTGVSNQPGVTAHGDRIPAHVVRHLAEQANLQRILIAGSVILNLGRETRYASNAQYRALLVRDNGCRWPECHIPAAWCEIDHLVPYSQHGLTDLDNLVLWCSHHHHEKHRPGVKVTGNAHHLQLQLANGDTIHCPPPHRTTTAAA